MGCTPSKTQEKAVENKKEPEEKPKKANLAGKEKEKEKEQKPTGADLVDPSKIKETWKIYDYNGNGKLSLAEIDKALVDLFPKYGKHKPVLIRSYYAADASEDGFIQYDEFETLIKMLSQYERLFQMFSKMDTNSDHRISVDEFKKGCKEIGITGTAEELEKEFSEIDQNQGGYILFDEFCSYMARRQHYKKPPPSEKKPKRASLAGGAAPKKEKVPFKGEDLVNPDKLKEAWDIYDYNGNGKLSLAEIDRALVELFPTYGKHKPALIRAYYAADKSGDGLIQFKEFEDLINLIIQFEELYKKFQDMDTDADRRITFEEFKKSYKDLGLPTMSDDELQAEFSKIDTNSGGMVLFKEFCAYMAKKKHQSKGPKESKPKKANLAGGTSEPTKKEKSHEPFKPEDLIDPAKIKETWDIYDYNGNGKLSLAEIDRALAELFPQYGNHKPVLIRSYYEADLSKDGYIQYSEFEKLIKLINEFEKYFQKFQHLDKDNDNRVGFSEFQQGYKELGLPPLSKEELKAEFDKIDTNHGGKILFNEFCAYMAKKNI